MVWGCSRIYEQHIFFMKEEVKLLKTQSGKLLMLPENSCSGTCTIFIPMTRISGVVPSMFCLSNNSKSLKMIKILEKCLLCYWDYPSNNFNLNCIHQLFKLKKTLYVKYIFIWEDKTKTR